MIMTEEQYYTGKYFVAFFCVVLFVVISIFVGTLFFEHDSLTPSSIVVNPITEDVVPITITGFALGVFGGGTVIMLTGWYLVKK